MALHCYYGLVSNETVPRLRREDLHCGEEEEGGLQIPQCLPALRTLEPVIGRDGPVLVHPLEDDFLCRSLA